MYYVYICMYVCMYVCARVLLRVRFYDELSTQIRYSVMFHFLTCCKQAAT